MLHYNRTTEQFLRMMPEAVRRNIASASGFQITSGSVAGNDFASEIVLPNSTLRFTHKPILSGICNSGKYMPCQFFGRRRLGDEEQLQGHLQGERRG